MKLYIGGYAQGKLKLVQETYQDKTMQIVDEDGIDDFSKQQYTVKDAQILVLNHVHLMIKDKLLKQEDVAQFVIQLCQIESRQPEVTVILICDEIGNGIVPIDPWERTYREIVGRSLITIAEQATQVQRVFCGIGCGIK